MHRIDSPGAAPGNLFTEGNPGTGTPATEVDAAWLNAIQEEIMSVLDAASIAPVKGTHDQLLAAIQALIAAGGGGGGGSPTWGSITGTISNQTDLQNALDGKAAVNHVHAIAGVTGLQTALDGKASLAANTFTSTQTIKGSSNGDRMVVFKNGSDTTVADILGHGTGGVSVGGGGQFVRLRPNGTDSSTGQLEVANTGNVTINGNATATGSVTATGGFQHGSSRRIKNNIAPLDGQAALDAIQALQLVEYDRKIDGRHAFGVIAEDLIDGPFEFAVVTEGGQAVAVEYNSLLIAGLRVTQELAARVDRLEALIGAAR